MRRRELLSGLLCLPAIARAQGSRSERISDVVSRAMAAHGIPGLSIATSVRGDIWTSGFGWADVENSVAATARTMYRTASMAKPVTAVAVLRLVESERLSLDDPAGKYLPAFLDRPGVTIRRLLQHTSGVRHYRNDGESNLTAHFADLASAMTLFENDPLDFEPGSRYLYTTFGYVVLGRIVEVVSGAPYMEFLRGAVLERAGMKSTVADDVYRIVPHRSRGYIRTKTGELQNAPLHDTSYKIPGGGLLSTAEDMVRFVTEAGEWRLSRLDLASEMFRPGKLANGKETGYGLGWGIEQWKGGRLMYSHSGGQAGVTTVMAFLPQEHVGLAIMMNLQSVRYAELRDAVLEILLAP